VFGLIYAFIKFYVWMLKAMIQLMAIMVVLMIALYAWMGLGFVWVVAPDKAAVARSTRKFNRWLNRTLRKIT
jgi:hypothetical protein